MTFQAPMWLLALLAVAALVVFYVLLQLRRKAYAARFTNVALLGSILPKRPGWRRHLAFGVIALGLATLVVSLAVPSTEVRVPRERATVVMAVDVSLSMQATDIEPDRFRAMQTAAKEFVDVLPERINLGLVSFAGTATTVVPPTTDRVQVAAAIDNLDLAEATAIGEAVFTSLTAIENFQSSLEVGDEEAPPAPPAYRCRPSPSAPTTGPSTWTARPSPCRSTGRRWRSSPTRRGAATARRPPRPSWRRSTPTWAARSATRRS